MSKFGDHRSSDPFGGIRVKRVAAKPEVKPTREQRAKNAAMYFATERDRWVMQGWGGFRRVAAVTRGSRKLPEIPAAERINYVVELRPSIGEGIFERPQVVRVVPKGK